MSEPRRRRRRSHHRRPARRGPGPWRLLRRVLAVAALCALALALIVGVLLATFDADRYRAEIAHAASAAIGRPVAIDGAVRLVPGLNPVLGTRDVAIAGTGKSAEFAHIGQVEAQVRLLPLLARRIEIVHLRLEDVSVTLATAAAAATAAAPPSSPGAMPTAATRLAVEDVVLRNIAIRYDDGDGDASGAPPPLALERATLRASEDGENLRFNARARFGGRIFDGGGHLPRLAALLSGAPAAFELHGGFEGLRLQAEGELAEPLAMRGLQASFTLEANTLAELAPLAGYALPDLHKPRLHGTISSRDRRAWLVEPLVLDLGHTHVEGRLELALDDARPRLDARLQARQVDLEPFMQTRAKAAAAPLVPAVPLVLPVLRAFDATVDARVDLLHANLSEPLREVHLDLDLDNGVLRVAPFGAALANGTVEGALELDGTATPPHLLHTLRVRDMTLTPFISAAEARNVRGGKLVLDLELDGRGNDLAALLATADGHLHARVDNVEIVDRKLDVASGDLLLGLFEAINPLARGSQSLYVECAVANFPLTGGHLEAATGIGVTTRRLNILGGGRIDLADERIDLAVDPKPREGIGLNAAALADFVRIGGTLRAPRVTTDAGGLGSAGLKAGAAVASGGLSLVAEGLLDRSEGDVDVCAVAAGDVAPPGSGIGQRAATAAGHAAKAAGGLLERAGQALGAGVRKLLD